MTHQLAKKAAAPNPALKPFEIIVGDWQTIGSHPYFPDTVLHGRASFEWIEGGAFLLMRSELNHPDFPDGIAIFGSDDDVGAYYMMYFDERGVSRKQDVTISEGQIRWWRDNPHFSQRYTMKFANDEIVSYGEMSRNGGVWERDLSLTYKKL